MKNNFKPKIIPFPAMMPLFVGLMVTSGQIAQSLDHEVLQNWS